MNHVVNLLYTGLPSIWSCVFPQKTPFAHRCITVLCVYGSMPGQCPAWRAPCSPSPQCLSPAQVHRNHLVPLPSAWVLCMAMCHRPQLKFGRRTEEGCAGCPLALMTILPPPSSEVLDAEASGLPSKVSISCECGEEHPTAMPQLAGTPYGSGAGVGLG